MSPGDEAVHSVGKHNGALVPLFTFPAWFLFSVRNDPTPKRCNLLQMTRFDRRPPLHDPVSRRLKRDCIVDGIEDAAIKL